MGNQIVMWDPDKKSSETVTPRTFEEIDIDERYDLKNGSSRIQISLANGFS